MDLVGPGANWRDADAYAPLLAADRSIFAWEWLRRDPGYRRAALTAFGTEGTGDAARPEVWGLCAFEHPGLAAPHARPMWTSRVYPGVLPMVAERDATGRDSFHLERIGGLASLVRTGSAEHLLLSDGLRAIRLDLLDGSLAAGPVRLRYLLAGIASAGPPLLTLQRLLSLYRSGRFSRSLHRAEIRALRWLLMLRAHDGLVAGVDQREIATVLLSAEAAEQTRWRVAVPSLRSRAQRLVRGAKKMAAGGYKFLLTD